MKDPPTVLSLFNLCLLLSTWSLVPSFKTHILHWDSSPLTAGCSSNSSPSPTMPSIIWSRKRPHLLAQFSSQCPQKILYSRPFPFPKESLLPFSLWYFVDAVYSVWNVLSLPSTLPRKLLIFQAHSDPSCLRCLLHLSYVVWAVTCTVFCTCLGCGKHLSLVL